MHDPMTVAFEIRSPWPKPAAWMTEQAARTGARWKFGGAFWVLAGHGLYFPSLITFWHREPGSRDSLTVCAKRVQQGDGTWRRTRGWRWHIHHWRIQIPPLQLLRRHLLTRCAWCGGRSVKGDQVNISHQWNRARGHWWQGERGLFHMDCSAIQSAHSTCLCETPLLDEVTYGRCSRCTKHRAYGTTPQRLARVRVLAAIPEGCRRP
ncbi:hypothetical protein [Streptomyces canus]|uniref:hypothetical protein n=1 Tax=Streptomyces canus TaxID=58343 RepID=UPI003863B9BB|nr:hypothetical protein OH824_17725 [Streptomyces canus]